MWLLLQERTALLLAVPCLEPPSHLTQSLMLLPMTLHLHQKSKSRKLLSCEQKWLKSKKVLSDKKAFRRSRDSWNQVTCNLSFLEQLVRKRGGSKRIYNAEA